MRRAFRLLIWLLAIYASVCLAAGVFLANSTLYAYHRTLPRAAESNMIQIAAGLPSNLADVQISAFDDAPLFAWYIQPQHSNGDAVILLHGLGDHRIGMHGYARLTAIFLCATLAESSSQILKSPSGRSPAPTTVAQFQSLPQN